MDRMHGHDAVECVWLWIEIAGQRRTDVPAMFVTGASGALADPHTLGTVGGVLLVPRRLVFDFGRRRMAVID